MEKEALHIRSFFSRLYDYICYTERLIIKINQGVFKHMSANSDLPTIAFVYRPNDIASAIIQAALNTETSIIYDLTGTDAQSAAKTLIQADASSEFVAVKIDAETFGNNQAIESIKEADVFRFFVEINAAYRGSIDDLAAHLNELAETTNVIPIVGDFEIFEALISKATNIDTIALKGSEAAGFVSSETIFTLYSGVKQRLKSLRETRNLIIWGGIAVPEAAAAFLATGAKGIVFESVHWLTNLVSADGAVKKKLSKIRPDHTDLVGLNLNAPCRFFDKGNSKAVKKLKQFAASLCGSEIDDSVRMRFADQIQNESINALDSDFGANELIPLGVEAAFAASFARRFGSDTESAITGFLTEIEKCLATSKDKFAAFSDSSVATELGITYPFIQGAMSWITDNPEFARRVADSGALPTLALGMMDEPTLEAKLGNLPKIMGAKPYAVNVITLNENPHRDVQLNWIKKIKPRFAVIAAGEPSHAADLIAAGIEAVYIAPTEELMKMAFEAGVKYVICEGNEAGGHVGRHSTITLAQMIMDLKYENPRLFDGKRIILAGGVCNRETAFMAAMLGVDAIQMGTIYLASKEIVETESLSDVYQQMIVDSAPGQTIITGESTGLRVRSLKTPCIEAICGLERDFVAGAEDESSFRYKIEALSAGSLYIAAKRKDKAGASVAAEACSEQGQFMSGACAGAITRVFDLNEIHSELAAAPLADNLPFMGPIRPKSSVKFKPASTGTAEIKSIPAPSRNGKERIAITGMSVVNSLGSSPEEVWANTLAMKSGITLVPPSKWNHDIFYNPRPRMPEKTYCKVAAFQSLEIDRKDLGIPPQDFRTMTDATKITMWLAQNAINESGLLDSDIPRDRIAVLSSQNSGEAAVTLQDVIIRGSADKIVSAVKRVVDLTPDMERAVEEEVKSGRIAIDDTTLLGRLNCSAGGFICNKYGFMGPSFSVSAACATALVALFSAYQMIRNGVIDAAVVGGGEEYLTPMHFLEFSALGALAGLSGVDRPPAQMSRPFDALRDGMVLGEGGGVIVIERESLARKRGAKIHALITSMGASNNHLGMVESSRITQEIAIKNSFNDAPYGPEKVDMIECHATSTRQGDVEEVMALKSFYSDPGSRTVLTSFKSQIGHTLGASGVNSLIRGIMAMNAGIIPGTLNYENPDPDIVLDGCGLEIHHQAIEWRPRPGEPRRMQVNAFGFGGSNYVVQVEQTGAAGQSVFVDISAPTSGNGKNKSSEGISFFRTEIGGVINKVAVPAESDEKAIQIINRAEPMSNGGGLAPKRIKSLARQGIFIAPESAAPNFAFVFPGQGSHYAGMGHELYQNFPVIKEWMDRANDVAEFDILDLMFNNREEDLQKTRWQQPALFTMEYAMAQYLWSLGIRPTAMAGHSLGELTALCLAGVYSFEDGFRIVNMRAICMDRACELHADPGVMMAVDAPRDVLDEMMSKHDDVYITNINSPHQLVVGGNTEQVAGLGAELKANGYRNTLLRVSMAFHSPVMRCIHDDLEQFIAGIKFHAPKIPVISNTTMAPFPNDTDEIKRIVMAHLETAVHWMQNVRTLWNDYGVRLFIEVGPREILSNLIADSIEDANCIPTCLPSAETVMFRNAVAQMYAKGVLELAEDAKLVQFPRVNKPENAVVRAVSAKPAAKVVPTPTNSLEGIVQREINSFVLESFGRFVKPNIIAAIRAQYDPQFSEDNLDQLFSGMFPGVDTQMSLPTVPITSPSLAESTNRAAAAQPARPASANIHAVVSETPRDSEEDTTDTVIRIIMEATGYDRDEIEPDMDLREDLSIRSSRLPVIMDSVEGHFGIKIELEDFMDVRTIRDISDKITVILSRDTKKKPVKTITEKSEPAIQEIESASADEQSLKRLVFREAPIQFGNLQPIELNPMDTVAVLCATRGAGIRKRVGDIIRRDYGCGIFPITFLEEMDVENGGFDFRSAKDVEAAIEAISAVEPPAGAVIILDDALETQLNSVEEISEVLKGLFAVLQKLLESTSKKFIVTLHKTDSPRGNGRLVMEGLLGVFLSAAQEFGSMQFRTARLDDNTDLRDAMRKALDRSQKNIEMIWKNGEAYTREAVAAPSLYDASSLSRLDDHDVFLFTGGCSGIAPFLAKSLVPFGAKIAFAGRTPFDPNLDYAALEDDEDLILFLEKTFTRLTGSDFEKKVREIKKGRDIHRTLSDLRSTGVDCGYFSADVGDAAAASELVKSIISRFGTLTGIVHGAGVLRDGFIRLITPEDFQTVVDVKFIGASNLFHAAKKAGLKHFICLSSAASIQGNPGQSNYAAANRIMSAFVSNLAARHTAISFKALMLPPISGAGMADNDEIRDLMKRMGAAYVHADELAALFCRELTIAPTRDTWALFMRTLPHINTVKLVPNLEAGPGEIISGAVAYRKESFPMIDSIKSMDLQEGEMVAVRTFDLNKDRWIRDHKPFKFMKNPLVSAIMAIETFLESSKILYPYLDALGIRNAEFLDILECMPDTERFSEITCKRTLVAPGRLELDVTLATQDISPTGRPLERMAPNYRASVIMGKLDESDLGALDGFPVPTDELDSRSMDKNEVIQWYDQRTDMLDRYRIMETIDGTGSDSVRGHMIYRAENDFKAPRKSNYMYSPYLLEALMQVVNFYIIMRDPNEQRSMIPYKIGEMLFGKRCEEGDRLTLEARMQAMDEEGIIWNARAVDKQGLTRMVARGIKMRWFTK